MRACATPDAGNNISRRALCDTPRAGQLIGEVSGSIYIFSDCCGHQADGIFTALVDDKWRDAQTSVGTGKYYGAGPEQSML